YRVVHQLETVFFEFTVCRRPSSHIPSNEMTHPRGLAKGEDTMNLGEHETELEVEFEVAIVDDVILLGQQGRAELFMRVVGKFVGTENLLLLLAELIVRNGNVFGSQRVV